MTSTSAQELERRLGVPDRVQFEQVGALTRMRARSEACELELFTHGAHVTHFRPAGGQPLLFLSQASRFEPGKGIRGGIPLVFPWFGEASTPPPMNHGFARTSEWALEAVEAGTAGITAQLTFHESPETRSRWPQPFRLTLNVHASTALELTLEVTNIDARPQRVETLFHTYLAVSDVSEVSVQGLQGRLFLDKLTGQRLKQEEEPLRIRARTDRLYEGAAGTVSVIDPARPGSLRIEKDGAASTVVWNPGQSAAELGDLRLEEWPRMLCVESGNVGTDALELAPGASHRQRLTLRPPESP